MKTSWFKSLIIAGSVVLVTGFTTTDVLAQRHGGGGGRGGGMASHGPSRGGMGGGFSRPSTGSAFRGGGIHRGGFGRPGYGFRPGYRPYRRPYYGYYHFYRPYLGLSFNVLPYGYYPFFFGADQFYYSGGLFYREYDNAYKVVVPPVGAEVPTIPSDAKEVVINGQTYYEYKGVYYSASQNADGKTVYVVAGKDGVLNTDNSNVAAPGAGVQVGDVVSELPDGYRAVTLKGATFYVTDDGIYYEKITDGDQVTYKVIGMDH